MELNFVREDIPKITRAGGSGREAEPWENHLATLKDTPEISFRVWDYEKRTSAVSRMSAVRTRLFKAVPGENWQLAVRPVPNSNPVKYGVYVAYMGTFSDEQVAANQKAHDERSAKVQKAQADRKAAEAAAPADAPAGEVESDASGGEVFDSQTPKERVKQAQAARKAS